MSDGVGKKFHISGTDLLNQIGGALITALEPKLNKQGARWKDVEYRQYVDDEMEQPASKDILQRCDDITALIKTLGTKADRR